MNRIAIERGLQSKARLKSLITGCGIRCMALIANGLTHGVPKKKTMDSIRKEIARLSRTVLLTHEESSDLYMSFLSRYISISRKTWSELRKAKNALPDKSDPDYAEALELRQTVCYQAIRPHLDDVRSDRTVLGDRIEQRRKREMLQAAMSEDAVFYLCSSHVNPAEDHADWEGKLYVKERWAEMIQDSRTRAAVRRFIRSRRIRTVEWVTGEPVYMVYRPNCKHYLMPVKTSDALRTSVDGLLTQMNMWMRDEPPLTDAQRQKRRYSDRLKELAYLKTMCPSKSLKADMRRTRAVLARWDARVKAEKTK